VPAHIRGHREPGEAQVPSVQVGQGALLAQREMLFSGAFGHGLILPGQLRFGRRTAPAPRPPGVGEPGAGVCVGILLYPDVRSGQAYVAVAEHEAAPTFTLMWEPAGV
jgi:hypothetical protein